MIAHHDLAAESHSPAGKPGGGLFEHIGPAGRRGKGPGDAFLISLKNVTLYGSITAITASLSEKDAKSPVS